MGRCTHIWGSSSPTTCCCSALNVFPRRRPSSWSAGASTWSGGVRRRGELCSAFPTHIPLKRRTWGAAAAPSADRAPRRATSRPYGSARHTRGASGSRPALHSRRHKSNTPGTELAPAAADACPPTVACHSERLASAGRGDTRGVGLFSASTPQLVLAGHGLRHLHLVRVVVSLALAVVAPHGAAGWRAFSGGDRQTRAMPSGTISVGMFRTCHHA